MSNFQNSVLSRFLLIFLLINSIAHSLSDQCPNEIPPKFSCDYTVNSTTNQDDFNLVQIKNLQLFNKDSLTVKIGDEDQKVRCSGHCLIVLPKANSYTFHVTTTEDPGKRSLGKIDALKEKSLSATEFQKFTIIIKPYAKNFKEIALTNGDQNLAILLNTENKGIKVAEIENNKPGDTFNLDDEDFLCLGKKLSLSGFEQAPKEEKVYNFNLIKIWRNCSSTQNFATDSVEVKTVEDSNSFITTTYTCVHFLKSDSNLKIDHFDLKDASEYDTITIKDGLKLTSPDLFNTKTKDASNNLNKLNELDRTSSSKNGIMVILSSSFLSNAYAPSSVAISKSSSVIVKKNKEETFKMELTLGKDNYFIFNLDNLYPYLSFGKSFNLTTNKLLVYDCLDLNQEPLLTFNENEIVNDALWADKNVLVLKFVNPSAAWSSDKVQLTSLNKNCNKMSNYPSTYALKGSKDLDDKSCSFYFKPQTTDSNPIILNVETLELFKDSSIELKSVNENKSKFNINFASEDIVKNHLTELILDSKDSYVLTYKQGKITFKEKILLQATFGYKTQPLLNQITLNKDEPIKTLTSYNYPSNYPYLFYNGADIINSTSYLYVSVEECDLRDGDKIKMFRGNTNASEFIKSNRSDDFIVGKNTTMVLTLQTEFDASKKWLQNEYVHGFKFDLEYFDCWLEFDSKTKSLQTPNYPNKFENASKCMGIVDLGEKAKYLDLTIENGKESVEFGELTVFDDPTKQRNNHTFYNQILKNNQTINFNITSTKFVIIFDPKDKNVINGFKLTVQVKDCPSVKDHPKNTCDDDRRCLLESILCNFHQECYDGYDEKYCVNQPSTPIFPPQDRIIYRGLSGWIIVFIIIPLSMIVGAIIHLKLPTITSRFRGHVYREFNEFGENA